MVGGRQQIAEAFEEAGLEPRRDRHLAPNFCSELSRFFGVAVGQIRGGECGVADPRLGRRGCKIFLDLFGAAAFGEQRSLEVLGQHGAAGPERVVFEKSFVFGEFAHPVPQADPIGELAADGVGDLSLGFGEAFHVVGANGADRVAKVLNVFRRRCLRQQRRQRLVELVEMFFLDGEELRSRNVLDGCIRKERSARGSQTGNHTPCQHGDRCPGPNAIRRSGVRT